MSKDLLYEIMNTLDFYHASWNICVLLITHAQLQNNKNL